MLSPDEQTIQKICGAFMGKIREAEPFHGTAEWKAYWDMVLDYLILLQDAIRCDLTGTGFVSSNEKDK